MDPIAYLTVEVKHRELESRILIASHLLQAGYTVVIGQQWGVFSNAAALPPGVILFKTVNEIQARNMHNFRANGHLVAATDEEVLICVEDNCFTLAFSEIAANNCDLFLAQSEAHRQAIAQKFPILGDKIEVVGNPRVDLLAPAGRQAFAAEAEKLRQEYGPYILFNTNYGSINSIWNGIEEVAKIAVRAGALNPNDPKSLAEFNGAVAWESRNRDEMLPLIQWVAKNLPAMKMVIRPHPAERPEFWHTHVEHYPQATIIPRSNPHPWILGSEAVVHTGCTTGLEAILLDKSAINIMPSAHPSFDRMVNHVNPTFSTWQDAAAALKKFLAKEAGPITDNGPRFEAALEGYLPGYRTGRSAAMIGDSMIALLKSHGATPRKDYTLQYRGEGFRRQNRHPTLKDKMTATPEELITAFKNLMQLSGPIGNVKISMLDESLFILSPQ